MTASRRDRARYVVSEYEGRIEVVGLAVWTYAATVGTFTSSGALGWVATALAYTIALRCFVQLWRLV